MENIFNITQDSIQANNIIGTKNIYRYKPKRMITLNNLPNPLDKNFTYKFTLCPFIDGMAVDRYYPIFGLSDIVKYTTNANDAMIYDKCCNVLIKAINWNSFVIKLVINDTDIYTSNTENLVEIETTSKIRTTPSNKYISILFARVNNNFNLLINTTKHSGGAYKRTYDSILLHKHITTDINFDSIQNFKHTLGYLEKQPVNTDIDKFIYKRSFSGIITNFMYYQNEYNEDNYSIEYLTSYDSTTSPYLKNTLPIKNRQLNSDENKTDSLDIKDDIVKKITNPSNVPFITEFNNHFSYEFNDNYYKISEYNEILSPYLEYLTNFEITNIDAVESTRFITEGVHTHNTQFCIFTFDVFNNLTDFKNGYNIDNQFKYMLIRNGENYSFVNYDENKGYNEYLADSTAIDYVTVRDILYDVYSYKDKIIAAINNKIQSFANNNKYVTKFVIQLFRDELDYSINYTYRVPLNINNRDINKLKIPLISIPETVSFQTPTYYTNLSTKLASFARFRTLNQINNSNLPANPEANAVSPNTESFQYDGRFYSLNDYTDSTCVNSQIRGMSFPSGYGFDNTQIDSTAVASLVPAFKIKKIFPNMVYNVIDLTYTELINDSVFLYDKICVVDENNTIYYERNLSELNYNNYVVDLIKNGTKINEIIKSIKKCYYIALVDSTSTSDFNYIIIENFILPKKKTTLDHTIQQIDNKKYKISYNSSKNHVMNVTMQPNSPNDMNKLRLMKYMSTIQSDFSDIDIYPKTNVPVKSIYEKEQNNISNKKYRCDDSEYMQPDYVYTVNMRNSFGKGFNYNKNKPITNTNIIEISVEYDENNIRTVELT